MNKGYTSTVWTKMNDKHVSQNLEICLSTFRTQYRNSSQLENNKFYRLNCMKGGDRIMKKGKSAANKSPAKKMVAKKTTAKKPAGKKK